MHITYDILELQYIFCEFFSLELDQEYYVI